MSQTIVRVLGIDVASAGWRFVGTALLTFDSESGAFLDVQTGVLKWPAIALSPLALADAIDDYARRMTIAAVALDGPQGWRDPAISSESTGVGRRCEYECRTQGKTGIYPNTYPKNQRGWIEFSVDLFAALLDKPRVGLAEPPPSTPEQFDSDYLVLECFPTSAWRSSGLLPLPGKSSKPDVRAFANSLADAYALPAQLRTLTNHDDLQAVVAALTAVGAVGGPVITCVTGVATRSVLCCDDVHRLAEGYIWNVSPLERSTNSEPNTPDSSGSRTRTATMHRHTHQPCVRVTSRVIEQVRRAGRNQAMITLRHIPGGTRHSKRTVTVLLDSAAFDLVIGDSHATWRTHQSPDTLSAFDQLFDRLSEHPDRWQQVDLASHRTDGRSRGLMLTHFPQAVPEIPVSNVDNAAEYYVNVLGFSFDWGNDDGGIGGISQGDCRMFLTNAPFRAGQGPHSPVIVWLNLNSKQDVDELFERWKGTGAKIVAAVEDKPWNLREFRVEDLDGNQLRVFYDFNWELREAGRP